MRPIVVGVFVQLLFYCPMYDSVAGYCIDVADICIVELLAMLYVAIFRNHFDDDIVAPNIDAPNNVAVVDVDVAVGFDAAIALARAVLATNSVALDVDCMLMMMMMMIVAVMMMVVVESPTMMCPLQTTFDCSESLIEPSENREQRRKNAN